LLVCVYLFYGTFNDNTTIILLYVKGSASVQGSTAKEKNIYVAQTNARKSCFST